MIERRDKMKSKMFKKLFLILFFVAMPIAALGQLTVPQQINIQAVVKDVSGNPVNMSYNAAEVSLWDAEVAGTSIWDDSVDVVIENGLAHIVLEINENIFASNPGLWLEIELNDDLVVARRQFISQPYAYHAETATNAAKLDGHDSGFFSADGHDHGNGTGGRIAKFTTASTIGDSLISEGGGDVTIDGNLTGNAITGTGLTIDQTNTLNDGQLILDNLGGGGGIRIRKDGGSEWNLRTWSSASNLNIFGPENSRLHLQRQVPGAQVYVGNSNGSWCGSTNLLCVETNAYAHGSFVDSSDERFKKDISTIDNALEKVTALRGVYYYWDPDNGFHSDTGRKIGVIAQEVEKVLPEVVHGQGNEYRGVAYGKLNALLVEAIKEQQKEIEMLKQLACIDHPEAEICSKANE